ncbi:MAG: uroporphyrinogen-III synthase [Gammaproteobacteria bacterium]|nr:uroporphyrinogen-III synthase [Gammaproteobacteria bacterium]
MSDKPLSGYTILVTRPAQQSDVLEAAIRRAGGKSLNAPMVGIRAIDDAAPARAVIDRLASFDLAVFTSRNAVDFVFAFLREAGKDLSGLTVFAVGLGTAARLKALGVARVQTPGTGFNSESLLALPALAKVAGKHVVIFRGGTGRELLATELTARGAHVAYCEVYQRYVPDTSLAEVLRRNDGQVPDVVVLTSVEGLENFVEKIAEEQVEQFYGIQPLVISRRIAQEVEMHPFTSKPIVAANPADHRVVQSLIEWAEGGL